MEFKIKDEKFFLNEYDLEKVINRSGRFMDAYLFINTYCIYGTVAHQYFNELLAIAYTFNMGVDHQKLYLKYHDEDDEYNNYIRCLKMLIEYIKESEKSTQDKKEIINSLLDEEGLI